MVVSDRCRRQFMGSCRTVVEDSLWGHDEEAATRIARHLTPDDKRAHQPRHSRASPSYLARLFMDWARLFIARLFEKLGAPFEDAIFYGVRQDSVNCPDIDSG